MTWSPAFPVFNFLSIAFLLLPSPWHWRARNTPTLLYIFWTLVWVAPLAINSVIWYDTADDIAPIWCDITTKLRIGASVGLPAAALCLTRQLESIAAARQVHFSAEDRRRRKIIELAIGLGLPFFVMVVHVVVQGHRYDIIQRVGCIPTIYWSYAGLFLVSWWPLVLLLISGVYATITIRLFIARRYQFAKILESSQSAITTNRFLRLIALALLQIAFVFPLSAFTIIQTLVNLAPQPYKSWAFVHADFNTVPRVPLAVWRLSGGTPAGRASELGHWVPVVASALFFVFFGVGDESVAVYRTWWTSGLRLVGISRKQAVATPPGLKSTAIQTHISLPRYPTSSKSSGEFTPPASSEAHDMEYRNGPEASYGGVVVTVEKDNFSSV